MQTFIANNSCDSLVFYNRGDYTDVQLMSSARNLCTFYSNGNVLSSRGTLVGSVNGGPLPVTVMASLVTQWRNEGKLS